MPTSAGMVAAARMTTARAPVAASIVPAAAPIPDNAYFGTVHQLVKPAHRAVGRVVLSEEGEAVPLERAEPFVPGNLLDRFLAAVAREVDAKHPGIDAAAGPAHAGGLAAARLHPLANVVTVYRRPCFRAGPPAPVSAAATAVSARTAM